MATHLSPASIDQYLSYISARGRSAETARAYKADLADLLAFAGVEAIALDDLDDRAAEWLTAGRSEWKPNTTARKRTAARSFAAWAGKPGLLHDYLLPDAGKPNPHPVPEGFDGAKRMLEAADGDPAKEALVALSFFAGCRIGEILSLTTDSIDLVDRVVTVVGKGDKTRRVPLAPGALRWIMPAYSQVYARQDGDRRLVPYKDRWARQVFSDLGKKAGLVRSVASHDGRATFATRVYQEVKDLRVVQELLGHADSRTTEVYTEASTKAMREAVEAAIPA